MSELGELNMDPTLEKQMRGHKGPLTAVAFNPVGSQLASSSEDKYIMIWKCQSQLRSYRFHGHGDAVMDVAYSPSGKLLASASRDRTVRLWVPAVTGETEEFKAHSQTVRSVQFTNDGLKLLTASDDKSIKLWSVAKQKFITSYVDHKNWVRCARLSSDSCVIASCSDDKTIKLWNIDNGSCIHTYQEHKGHALHLAWHPSGCYLAVGLSNGTVKLYDTRTHSLLQHYRIHDDSVTQLSFHPSGSYLLTSSRDGKMKILDLMEGHPIYTLNAHSGPITAVAFSPDGEYFASGGDDKLVMIWKTNFIDMNEIAKEDKNHTNFLDLSSIQNLESKMSQGLPTPRNRTRWFQLSSFPKGTYTALNPIAEDNEIPCNTPLRHTQVYNSQIYNSTPSSPHTRKANLESFNPDVGDMSHIPRSPPKRLNVVLPDIPKLRNNDVLTGVISLEGAEYCYTNGVIEWVGKKRYLDRSIMEGSTEKPNVVREPVSKRKKSCTVDDRDVPLCSRQIDEEREFRCCECPEVLPAVATLVENLNLLHEAVEIVDERLNEVEMDLYTS